MSKELRNATRTNGPGAGRLRGGLVGHDARANARLVAEGIDWLALALAGAVLTATALTAAAGAWALLAGAREVMW